MHKNVEFVFATFVKITTNITICKKSINKSLIVANCIHHLTAIHNLKVSIFGPNQLILMRYSNMGVLRYSFSLRERKVKSWSLILWPDIGKQNKWVEKRKRLVGHTKSEVIRCFQAARKASHRQLNSTFTDVTHLPVMREKFKQSGAFVNNRAGCAARFYPPQVLIEVTCASLIQIARILTPHFFVFVSFPLPASVSCLCNTSSLVSLSEQQQNIRMKE